MSSNTILFAGIDGARAEMQAAGRAHLSQPRDVTLRFLGAKCTGLTASGHPCASLAKLNSDVCGLSVHWLYSKIPVPALQPLSGAMAEDAEVDPDELIDFGMDSGVDNLDDPGNHTPRGDVACLSSWGLAVSRTPTLCTLLQDAITLIPHLGSARVKDLLELVVFSPFSLPPLHDSFSYFPFGTGATLPFLLCLGSLSEWEDDTQPADVLERIINLIVPDAVGLTALRAALAVAAHPTIDCVGAALLTFLHSKWLATLKTYLPLDASGLPSESGCFHWECCPFPRSLVVLGGVGSFSHASLAALATSCTLVPDTTMRAEMDALPPFLRSIACFTALEAQLRQLDDGNATGGSVDWTHQRSPPRGVVSMDTAVLKITSFMRLAVVAGAAAKRRLDGSPASQGGVKRRFATPLGGLSGGNSVFGIPPPDAAAVPGGGESTSVTLKRPVRSFGEMQVALTQRQEASSLFAAHAATITLLDLSPLLQRQCLEMDFKQVRGEGKPLSDSNMAGAYMQCTLRKLRRFIINARMPLSDSTLVDLIQLRFHLLPIKCFIPATNNHPSQPTSSPQSSANTAVGSYSVLRRA
jgi:hypothetical protein